MTIHISALASAPDFAQGFVKDLRVRWALEEAGLSYEAVLIDPGCPPCDPYRRWQPFGQVPAYRDGTVDMFESGAIVLYLAARSEVLAPQDTAGRARVASWVFAAQTTLQPHVDNHDQLRDVVTDDARARLDARLTNRLSALAGWLGSKDYLEDRFTAGDLMMTTVLRELVDSDVFSHFAALAAYHDRCTARPAFARALDAQMQPFRAGS